MLDLLDLMYYFYYNFIKKHFDAELLFTDRVSLTYKIKSEHLFDISNYPEDSKFFDETNKIVSGKCLKKSTRI